MQIPFHANAACCVENINGRSMATAHAAPAAQFLCFAFPEHAVSPLPDKNNACCMPISLCERLRFFGALDEKDGGHSSSCRP
jgi:hypothetical protein